jgi:putative transposase
MSQSLSKIHLHITFSTKERFPFLIPRVRTELEPYLARILVDIGNPPVTVGAVADHIHILCALPRATSVASLIEEIKTCSSKWVKLKGVPKFYWQSGYAAFSVSASHVEAVQKYIQSQEQHHKRMTFQDELRKFLDKYKVDYDEKYVWT